MHIVVPWNLETLHSEITATVACQTARAESVLKSPGKRDNHLVFDHPFKLFLDSDDLLPEGGAEESRTMS